MLSEELNQVSDSCLSNKEAQTTTALFFTTYLGSPSPDCPQPLRIGSLQGRKEDVALYREKNVQLPLRPHGLLDLLLGDSRVCHLFRYLKLIIIFD